MYLIILHFVIGVILVKSLARRLGLQSLTAGGRRTVVFAWLLFWEVAIVTLVLRFALSKLVDFCIGVEK